jgi:hypothetical protein
MKRLWHHIKKDFKHLKYFIFAWFILVVLQQLPLDRMLELEASTAARIPGFLSFFKIAVLFIMVPLLIQSDSLVGSSASWFSRPISRKELLTAKALFILIFISGTALLWEILFLAFRGVTAGDILAVVPGILMETLVPVIPLVILAAITPDLKRFVIYGITTVFVSAIVMRLVLFFLNISWLRSPAVTSLAINMMRGSNVLVFELLVILLGGAVIIHQFLTRKTSRSILLTAAAFIFALLAAAVRPWNFLEAETAVNRLQANDQRIRDLKVSSSSKHSGGSSWNMGGESAYTFSYRTKYYGIPKAYFLRLDSLNNGNILFPGNPTASTFSLSGESSSSAEGRYRALQEVFAPLTFIANPIAYIYSTPRLRFEIGPFTSSWVQRWNNFKGTLSADAVFHLCCYKIVARLPLTVGSQCKKGYEFIRVAAVRPEGNGCTVKVKCQYTHFKFKPKCKDIPISNRDYFMWKNMEIVLHNKERREILILTDWGSRNIEIVEPDNDKRVDAVIIDLPFKNMYKNNNYFPRIDDSWVADAELVCLEEECIGGFTKPLRFENVRFPPSGSGYGYSVSNRGDMIDKLKTGRKTKTSVQPLGKIRLPENADKKQVKEYIRQILWASKDQKRLTGKDIQVEMLAQVGPEHIDALAEVGNMFRRKFYVFLAIMRIARPEDKDVILKILGDYPDLLQMVLREGWVRDIRDVIAEKFENPEDHVYYLWFKAAIALKDKSLYPHLKQYLFDGGFGSGTECYDMIKNLPGIDLSDTILQLWGASKYGLLEDVGKVVPYALEWGLVDALEVAFDLVEDSRLTKSQRDRLWKTINKYIEYKGDKPGIIRWFRRNKDHFIFDKQEKKFLIRY